MSAAELERASAVCDLDGRGVVIPNCIAPAEFDDDFVANILPLDRSRIVVAMAAGFTRGKGLHLLLEAAAAVKGYSFTVLLMGESRASYLDHRGIRV